MRKLLLIFATLAIVMSTGCKAPSKPPANPPPSLAASEAPVISNTDPSAAKLHDLSGAMLMYFALNKRLPTRLEELQPLADGDAGEDLFVPGTRTPYVYSPDGIVLQDQAARIVIYEPAPLHGGHRLAVRIDDPAPDKTLVARVISLPESFFLLRPPGTEAPAAR